MSGIPADQVLAICRIKQWAIDRSALKTSRTTEYRKVGWQQRTNRNADARLVRTLDFERAFARLSQEEQMALAYTYRDGYGHTVTALALGCSERKLCYLLPAARSHLADILDRLDLL